MAQLTRRETIALTAMTALAPSQAIARTKNKDAFEVAVIGAGVFGAWTAWHLAKAGIRVALIEQYGAGHARASSGGESRVIRLSYGGDALYSPMALSSLGQWEALSARQSLPILLSIGVLWFSPKGDSYMAKSVDWLTANGLAVERGDATWMRSRFPQITFKEDEVGFLEPGTGALIAGRGVQAVVADAKVELHIAQATLPQRMTDGSYRLPNGYTARHLVYACGPWLPKLFPDILKDRIVPTRQEVFHFGTPSGDRRFAPPALPVWADFNAGEIVYGLPDLEGQGFKLAFDAHGPVVDPDTFDRRVAPEGVEKARAYLAARFPGLANAPLIHSRVCQYENSSNGDFLIDRLPGHDRVWLVGGGSGHGFKHGPAVGERVAKHVIDDALPVEPRFSLASKGTVAARSVY